MAVVFLVPVGMCPVDGNKHNNGMSIAYWARQWLNVYAVMYSDEVDIIHQ